METSDGQRGYNRQTVIGQHHVARDCQIVKGGSPKTMIVPAESLSPTRWASVMSASTRWIKVSFLCLWRIKQLDMIMNGPQHC
ncbi:hypothetical protein GCM10010965_24720 [Caldalkalibacillus thermarum]|nr:hypothetical protein GCM10010965_24720 [Caldalkalibacillus thermarum]